MCSWIKRPIVLFGEQYENPVSYIIIMKRERVNTWNIRGQYHRDLVVSKYESATF